MKRLWMVTLLCILMTLGSGLVIGNAQNDDAQIIIQFDLQIYLPSPLESA